jgi:hypothetical protein
MTKYSKYKDFNLRKRLKENESNIFILKSFLLNKKTSKKIRFKIMLKIHKLYTGLLGNKYKNRCMSSTKVRSVNRLTNLTKSTFKEELK